MEEEAIISLPPLALYCFRKLLPFSLVFISCLSIYRFNQRNLSGPKTWPVIGATIELLRNYHRMHDWLADYLADYKTFKVPLPFTTYTYTADPINVEHMLKVNFSNYPKGDLYRSYMDVLLGDGIFNADGEMWKKQRKTASFEFASKNLRDFSTIVFREYGTKLSGILCQTSIDNKDIDMQDLFMRMTLDSICKVGFGVEIGTLSTDLPENAFANAFDTANSIVTLRFVDPLWKLKRIFRIGSEAVLDRCIKVVDDFTYDVIRRRKEEMVGTKGNGSRDKGQIKHDILSRFIELGEDPESNFSDDKSLRDVVLNFVIAGRDTTATTLSWFTYMIMTHPHVAEKIYLHACITETLRLYPAVPQDPKGVLEDDVLPDGTKVKAGGLMTYVPYSMGRMAYNWGEDAASFKPERWIEDGILRNVSPFKFTAFQAGPRICLGKDSVLIICVIIVRILTDIQWWNKQ